MQNELPPWITRLRIWDSAGTSGSSVKTTSPASITTSNRQHGSTNTNGIGSNINGFGSNVSTTSNYYYSPQSPLYGKNIKVNIDNVWNPVDTYIYGPTQNSIFNYPEHKLSGVSPQKFDKFGNALANVKETLNYASNSRGDRMGSGNKDQYNNGGGGGGDMRRSGGGSTSTTAKAPKHSSGRKLIAEHYDNETPRLCDHSLLNDGESRMRPCSPLESYVSTSRDMVNEAEINFILN